MKQQPQNVPVQRGQGWRTFRAFILGCVVGGLFVYWRACVELLPRIAANSVAPSIDPAPSSDDRRARLPEIAPLEVVNLNIGPEAPVRPDWMQLTFAPAAEEIGLFTAFDNEYRSARWHIVGTKAYDVSNDDEAARVIAARDRILSNMSEAPPGFWAWNEVKQVLTEIGTPARPLYESSPGNEPTGCLAFYEPATDRLAFCARGVSWQSAADLEGMLIHEATHIVIEHSLARRSGYSSVEIAAISMRCGDVAEEQLFATEGAAFWNQAAYLRVRSRESPSPLLQQDLMVRAASAALLNGSAEARQAFARGLVRYTHSGSENPFRYRDTRRCGTFVAVRGPRAGRYVLSLDILPHLVPIAEFAPNFSPPN